MDKMLVKINGQIVAGDLQACAVKHKVVERKKSVTSRALPLVVSALATLAIVEPSVTHAASTTAVVAAQPGEYQFQDLVIKSLTVDVTIMAVLFAFKSQWFKTFGVASGIVYGGFFCAQTLGMMLAVFFTWLNQYLQHALTLLRMG
jgi:hypothetical protein